MTRGALQPMRSSEIAESAAPVACFVCDAANTHEAEYCRRCLGSPVKQPDGTSYRAWFFDLEITPRSGQ